MMPFVIKTITPHQTLAIRHEAMWPHKPLAFVKLKNDDTGRHYGLFIQDQLVSVISLFIEKGEAQFRKFATLPQFQGIGYGSQLLGTVLEMIELEGYRKVWCNARVNKANYYAQFGLQQTKTTFEKAGIHYVVMEKIYP